MDIYCSDSNLVIWQFYLVNIYYLENYKDNIKLMPRCCPGMVYFLKLIKVPDVVLVCKIDLQRDTDVQHKMYHLKFVF